MAIITVVTACSALVFSQEPIQISAMDIIRVTPAVIAEATSAARRSDQLHQSSPADAAADFLRWFDQRHGSIYLRPRSIGYTTGFTAEVSTPAMALGFLMSERLRKGEALDAALGFPIDAIGIVVTPTTLNSPDIVRVILAVNNQRIDPVASTLKPVVLSNRLGATITKHSGAVYFPLSALEKPGVALITLVPEAGENIVFGRVNNWLDGLR